MSSIQILLKIDVNISFGKPVGSIAEGEFSVYMAMVSNPIRSRILQALCNFPSMPYLKLMSECHLTYPSQCGVFTYHLRKLIDAGAVQKGEEAYALTSLGRNWVNLVKQMEAKYKNKEIPSEEFDLEKWCPYCLKAKLKVKITPQTIFMLCKSPECILGGAYGVPPRYYFQLSNEIPDWRERGLDFYDLIQRIISRTTPEEKKRRYHANKCLFCGNEAISVEEFGPWYSKYCSKCDSGWGGVHIIPWETPETMAFLKAHPKVAETFLYDKVTVDGKACWGVTATDVETHEKLIMYIDAETFKPVKTTIDYEGKPVAGEMTSKELIEKYLSFRKT